MPTLEEKHLGLGGGELTARYDPEFVDEAKPYRHVVFYRHGKPFGAFVILAPTVSREGVTLSGYGPGFWLGTDNDGPVIENREYIAGNNQLDFGDFEALDALNFPEGWDRDDGSRWARTHDDVHSGSHAISVTGGLGKDDVLKSSQPRDVPAGALVRASCWALHVAGTEDRVRLRTVYEGRFAQPDLLGDTSFIPDIDNPTTHWANESEFEGDITFPDDDTIVMGPITQPQYVENGDFATGDFTGWVTVGPAESDIFPSAPVAPSHSGDYAAAIVSLADNEFGAIEAATGPGVAVGETYRLQGYAREIVGTTGEAKLTLILTNDNATSDFASSGVVRGSDFPGGSAEGQWKVLTLDYEVRAASPQVLSILPRGEVQIDNTGGEFQFDDITLTRIKGNHAQVTAPKLEVIPEKSYKLFAPMRGSWSSSATRNGTVHYLIVIESSSDRADLPALVLQSTDVDVSQSSSKMVLEHTFTPPSGYDRAKVMIVGTDLQGGSVRITKPTFRCEDTANYVIDRVIGPDVASYTMFTQDSVAPVGTQKVHLEMVGENIIPGSIWHVDDVEWHRTEAVTSPEAMVDDFLRHPDTDEYLVNPGTIHDLGDSQVDWYAHNLTNRTALLKLLQGGRLSPPREFFIDADNKIHVGLPEELFEDRAPQDDGTGFVFIEPDLLLLSRLEVKASVEDYLTRVKVIGQALQRKPPLPDAYIKGSASTTIPGARDWNNNPVLRTRLVEDSSITFAAAANARAADELDAASAGGQSLSLELSEWSAWGTFDVGDWLYVYKPEALLQDLGNPMNDRSGRRVYPARKRCLSRKLTMAPGDGFEVKIRRPDGTFYDVPDRLVRWDKATRATIELGDVRVDFTNDPQGHAAGVESVRRRAMQAR